MNEITSVLEKLPDVGEDECISLPVTLETPFIHPTMGKADMLLILNNINTETFYNAKSNDTLTSMAAMRDGLMAAVLRQIILDHYGND